MFLVSLYSVIKLLCHELHLVGFHVSFKYQIKHQIFVVPGKQEEQFRLQTSRTFITFKNRYIHQQYSLIFIAQIHAFLSKIIYGLTKEP